MSAQCDRLDLCSLWDSRFQIQTLIVCSCHELEKEEPDGKRRKKNVDFFSWIGSSTYSPSGCWIAMSTYGKNNMDSALCFSRQWHLLSLPINVVLINATEMKEAVSSFDLITVHYLTRQVTESYRTRLICTFRSYLALITAVMALHCMCVFLYFKCKCTYSTYIQSFIKGLQYYVCSCPLVYVGIIRLSIKLRASVQEKGMKVFTIGTV